MLLTVPAGYRQLHPAFGFAASVPRSLSLDRVVSLVLPWLRDCDKKHAACQEPNIILPRRLINIAGDLRLFDNGEGGGSGLPKYATLSHCWGDEKAVLVMPKTLSANINERMRGIDWEELPPVFRDAIQISRALGCAYIWIDALCIVQDDPRDWRAESAKMAQVYSGAYFNLAASALRNSSGTMFRDRTIYVDHAWDLVEHPMDTYEMTDFPNSGCKVSVRRSFDRPHHSVYGLSWYSRQQDPLLNRAWVFQERILSRRTIHFGTSEIMWECRSCYHCECGMIAPTTALTSATPTATPMEDITVEDLALSDNYLANQPSLGDISVPRKAVLSKICSAGVSTIDVFNFWMQTVSEYSLLDLTWESDRLVALGGIARKVQQAMGFTYLAGIWLEDLPRSLLWSGAGINRSQRPSLTPSWSWIARPRGSILAKIHWDAKLGERFTRDPRLQIHNAGTFCRYVDDNPFGDVLSGQIQMSAAYVRGTLRQTISDPERHYPLYVDLADLNGRLTRPSELSGDHRGVRVALILEHIYDLTAPELVGSDVHWLFLGTSGAQKSADDSQDCILIVKAHPSQDDNYLRVGISDCGRRDILVGGDTGHIVIYSPGDLKDLFSDADVKLFTLV
ncbi:hypothetical protein MFIFM68171_07327 [Madurella fahalii]|uniref:Heterokaryon incompatibility domain-containing protein n=1 Tax=Madurella fahalii TaxID=1157608 RepID=A0ABQ0GH90_9PEZI